MQLGQMSPEDLIRPSWLTQYEKEITAIWWKLVRLSSNLFILKKMDCFPFDLFAPIPQPFWILVRYSLFDTSAMTIWQVALDSSADALTLWKLRNSIVQNLREEEYRSRLKDVLRRIDFDGTISHLAPRIADLRNKILAHMDRDLNLDATAEQIKQMPVHLSDLLLLQDKVNSLFSALCFGHQRSVYPIQYHPEVQHPSGVDSRPDIDRLLDCVARESGLLNMPERQRQVWPHWRSNLSPDQLHVLNECRVRFGLPEV